MSLLVWILCSLVAISIIGDFPYVALVVTALAGIAFGLNAYLDFSPHPVSSAMPGAPSPQRAVVARHGWLLDAAATILLVFPTRGMVIGFICVLLSCALRRWARGRFFPQTAFDLPILALLLMAPVSLWASADLSVSLIPLGQIVAGVNLFYALTARVETERDLSWAVAGLLLLGGSIALLAPFGVDWIKTKFLALPSVYDRFLHILPDGIHPNLLAGALVLVIPLALAILLYAPLQRLGTRARFARALIATGVLWMAAILLLSQSRGGITATLAGLLLLLAFKGRRVVGSALALLVGGAAWVFTQRDPTRLADLFFSTDTVSGLAGRLEIWSRAVYALQDVPYTGIGLGMFSRAVKVLYPLFLAGPDTDVGYAHNIFLQVGVDLGIPGLVAYVALVVLGLVLGWKAFLAARERRDGDRAAVALGLAVSLIAIQLHGVVDSAVWDTKPAILSWMLLGVIAAADRVPSALSTGIESQWTPAASAAARVGSQPAGPRAVQREQSWFEHGARQRHGLDRILYDSPAFDTVVQAGLDFLGAVPGERVLDLGCGEGKETAQFARRGLHVVALDLSYAQLMRARGRLNGHAQDGSVHFIQADAEHLPLAPDSIRLVYGKAVLHHLDRSAAARELRRIMQPNGRGSFAEPLAHHPLLKIARGLTPQFRSRDETPLTLSDLDGFARRFDRNQIGFRFLVAPLAYVFRLLPCGESWFRRVHIVLQRFDGWLLGRFPGFKRWTWYGLVHVERDSSKLL